MNLDRKLYFDRCSCNCHSVETTRTKRTASLEQSTLAINHMIAGLWSLIKMPPSLALKASSGMNNGSGLISLLPRICSFCLLSTSRYKQPYYPQFLTYQNYEFPSIFSSKSSPTLAASNYSIRRKTPVDWHRFGWLNRSIYG